MIQPQQTLNLSPYSQLYDLLVKKDNELRRIHDEIDLGFVYTELVKNYSEDNGRTAVDPIRMFRYLLLKVIFDLSDASVVERSMTDLSFKYFLDMSPEETNLIDPSSLTKFRKLRLRSLDLLNLLIGRTIMLAREKKLIRRGTIIIDATHSTARALSYDPREYLKLRIGRLRHSLEPVRKELADSFPVIGKDASLDEMLEVSRSIIELVRNDEVAMDMPVARNLVELMEEAIDDTISRGHVSKDKDARLGHKSVSKPFFGTKEHLAIEADTGLVCAAVVTSGEKTDDKYVEELVDQSRSNFIDVDSVIADKAYSTTANLELADRDRTDDDGNPILEADGSRKKNFTLYSNITKNVSQGLRKDVGFYYNKDAGMMTCPAGHLAKSRCYHPKNKSGRNPAYEYRLDVEKCKVCPLREGCYKPGTKTKTYQVRILPDLHKSHIEFEKTDEFREKMRERYKIEAKNADLKQNYGLGKATSYGLENMTMQTALSIFACNIRRILRLTGK